MASVKSRTIWYTRCPVGNATEVALELGWLKAEFRHLGYELKSLNNADKQYWPAHFTHDCPALLRDGGNIPPIWARSRGARTKVIGLSYLNRSQAIIVKPEVDIDSITELKGKKVALPKRPHEAIDFARAAALRGIEAALILNGLEIGDVKLIDIQVNEPYLKPSAINDSLFGPKDSHRFLQAELAALAEGAVDAIYTSGGRASEAERLGLGRIIYDLRHESDWLARTNICHPSVITVSAQLAESNHRLVTVYLKTLIRAARWAQSNREDALNILARGTFAETRDFETGWPVDFNRYLEPHLTDNDLGALEFQKAFLLKNDFIENDFDLSAWIDASFIEEAQKETQPATVNG